MDLSKYRHLYVSETQENLDNLGRLLVELEASPGHRAHIDTVFRLLHSIKGMSGTMGYPPICNLAHRLEDLMAQVRSNRVPLDAPAIDALLAGVDRMGQWVVEVEADQSLSATPSDAALLDRVGQLLAAPADARSAPDLAPLNTGRPRNASAFPGLQPPPLLLTPMNPGELLVEVTARPECPDPGARGFLLLRKLAPLGTVVDAAPAESELRAGRLLGPLRLNFVTPHAAEHIEAYIRLMPDWAQVSVVDRDASQVSLPPDEFGQETDSLVAGDPDLLGALDGLDFDFMDSAEIVQTPSPVLPQPWTSAVTSTPSPLSQGPPALGHAGTLWPLPRARRAHPVPGCRPAPPRVRRGGGARHRAAAAPGAARCQPGGQPRLRPGRWRLHGGRRSRRRRRHARPPRGRPHHPGAHHLARWPAGPDSRPAIGVATPSCAQPARGPVPHGRGGG
jgi:HPt (histidine-containing phosphotransfer) domain-containing protein